MMRMVKHWKRLPQRGGRFFILGNIQGQVGRGSEQPDLVEKVPTRCRGDWTRWPLKVPSNPNHSMILWFCLSANTVQHDILLAFFLFYVQWRNTDCNTHLQERNTIKNTSAMHYSLVQRRIVKTPGIAIYHLYTAIWEFCTDFFVTIYNCTAHKCERVDTYICVCAHAHVWVCVQVFMCLCIPLTPYLNLVWCSLFLPVSDLHCLCARKQS